MSLAADRFEIVHQPERDTKPQRLVGVLAQEIFEVAIAAHFGQSLRGSPMFGCLDQLPPDPLPAQIGVHVPSFDITDARGQ